MTKRIFAAIMAFVLMFSCVPVLRAQAADVTPAAGGTTYYVSSLHGATDNNGTSQSTPFDSLLKINEITLQPGDRVLLERGSVFVDEYLHIKGSGSKDAPIIIDVYGDESLSKPLIQTNAAEGSIWYQDYGKSLDNTWHKYQGNVSSCILLYDVEYIEISNLAMTNEGNFADGESYNTYGRMDRTGVAGIAENIGTVDHIYLRNLDVRNVQGSVHDKHMANGGIYLLCHNPDDEAATGVARYDDVRIEGCRLDEVNRWGIAVGYTAYWDKFVYGPTIDPEVCQTYGSTNVVIRNNYLTNIGGDGITTMYCYQPVMEYNVLDGYCNDMTLEIYGNNNQRVAAGIWPWMCKTPILQYNEAYNSTPCPDAQAWDADWGDNAIYQYNYSCNNAGGAVMFCGQYACNTVFRYNISQYDLAGVLNLAGSPNGEIYNNVFYIKEGVKINRDGMSGGKGNTISNNIFYYTGSEPASAVYGNWGDIEAQWSNNIYYNYETTPDDKYAITADPMFVDPGKGPTGAQDSGLVHDRSVFDGYKLQDGSPAIDAGMPIENNGGKDFFGNEVDLLPDIGAYDAGTCSADASKAVVVNLALGETVTLTDLTGDYSGTTPQVDNDKIASVVLTRKESIAQSTASSTAATSLEAGASYLICNTNTGSALTNVIVDAPAWGTRALQLSADKTVSNSNTWILEASGSNYKFQSADGSYLSIDLNASSLGTSGDIYTAATSGSSDVWTFRNAGGYYLDNLGRMDFLGGWTEIGNSSTWKLYKITSATLDAATELTFTGLFPGTANIIVGDTLYQVRVDGQVEEVELKPGETVTFTDDSGNYTNADTSSLDASVATVTLSGAMTDGAELGSAVTSLVSGGKYILVNTRAKKPVTNIPASAAAAAGAGSGLNLSGSKEDLDDSAIWTITGAGGSYTVQDQDGKYMTVDSNSAGITSTATQLELNYNGSTWTISRNSAYLNDFGGRGSCAAGWVDNTASYDGGSQWEIYEVNYTSGENGTQITFTGVGNGETSVLIGDVMYHITVTGGPCTHPNYTNGFCDSCDAYQPAARENGVFQIANGGQLYWFAQLVDGGELTANAVLTADITVNQDVLINGELNEEGDFRNWNPIGSSGKKYAGTFDGQDHCISGLYYDKDGTLATHIGLFATLDEGAVVENVHLQDSYLAGQSQVGGIAGRNLAGTIRNCSNSAVITGYGSDVGGIVGINQSTVFGCTNSGAVTGENENVGGIAGRNTESTVNDLEGVIEQSANTGAVAGVSNSNESYVGGIAGRLEDGSVIDCYNIGAISSKGEYVGGLAGGADSGTIRNCHNIGSVKGKAEAGPILGGHYSAPAMTNCYYQADSESDSYDGTTAKSAAVFASGEVTWLLNGSESDESVVWKQTIGTDAYPKFTGLVVCYDADKDPTYFNDLTTHEHVFDQEIATEWYLATPADCENAATYYYSCSCGLKGTETFSHGEALGHDYGDPTFTWTANTAKASFVCSRDASHVHEMDATVTSTTVEGDCLHKAVTTYVATVTFEEVTYTDAKIVEGNLGDHADENADGKCDVCGELLGVIRVAGANRWATALLVADEMKAALGAEKFDAIIIASGNDFADALAGSYLATVKNAPILLSYGGDNEKYAYLDNDNINYVKENLAQGGKVYILGGEKAVPTLYEDGLEGYDVVRLGGANRFETNILILEEAGIADGSEVLVCTSANFADSLSASATGKPILLVWNDSGALYGSQPEFLSELKEKGCSFTILGGENAVSAKLADEVAKYGEVDRLAGNTRMETSVLVAEKYFDAPETAVLAYAWNYPDGLCGGSLAYALKAPLILTMPKYEQAAVDYAAENDITTGYVLGGDGLIGDAEVRAIFAMAAADQIVVKN